MEAVMTYLPWILGALLVIEQVLASVPSLKSNSTFQLICNITEALVAGSKKFAGVTPALPPVVTQTVQQVDDAVKGVAT